MDLNDNKEFFRYLVSKVVQTTPSDWAPDLFADNVFRRAKLVYEKVREYEVNESTEERH